MTIDLSTNPEGPYVTSEDRWSMEYVGRVAGSHAYIYRAEHGDLYSYSQTGVPFHHTFKGVYDLIPAPVEPEKRLIAFTKTGEYLPSKAIGERIEDGTTLIIELSVDEHGIPIDGSVVKRVEP